MPPGDDEVWEWANTQLELQPWPGGQRLAGSLQRVCSASRWAMRFLGTAVTLMSREGAQGVAAASGDRAHAIAALEFDLGEGPSRDAFAQGRPVLAPDLFGAIALAWPGFSSQAAGKGVGAAYAFPLQVGASRLGVMSMYSDQPRRLSDLETDRASAFAEITTQLLLDTVSTEQEVASFDLATVLDERTEVFQAQGMVMIALGVDLPEALARMRAHAFANARDLDAVALDIVERRLIPTAETM